MLGRYGLHFHVNDDSSRGSLVEGVVVRDTGAHAHVAHQSHGVTFRDDVAYNTYGDAYWWDVSPDTRTEGPETNDTLYDHAIAALVNGDNDEGYRLDRVPDGIPPQVTIAAPLEGGHVSGTVPVRVDAFDDVRVTRVEWLVDGVVEGSDSSAPFAFAWDTGGVEDRSGHRLQLKAYDAAGNANLSGIRTVFVGRDATP